MAQRTTRSDSGFLGNEFGALKYLGICDFPDNLSFWEAAPWLNRIL
jgi:hypothetical protein